MDVMHHKPLMGIGHHHLEDAPTKIFSVLDVSYDMDEGHFLRYYGNEYRINDEPRVFSPAKTVGVDFCEPVMKYRSY